MRWFSGGLDIAGFIVEFKVVRGFFRTYTILWLYKEIIISYLFQTILVSSRAQDQKFWDPGDAIWQSNNSQENMEKWSKGLQGQKKGVRGPICFLAEIPAVGAGNTCAYLSPCN